MYGCWCSAGQFDTLRRLLAVWERLRCAHIQRRLAERELRRNPDGERLAEVNITDAISLAIADLSQGQGRTHN